MMTSQELEQTTLLFLKQLYEIVDATNAPIYQINLTKVADSVGLKTIPSQDVLYGNFPTSYPTLEDAIKICNAMRTIKQKAKTITQKEVDAIVKQKDDLQKEVIELTNLKNNLKSEIARLETEQGKLHEYKIVIDALKKEISSLYGVFDGMAHNISQIKEKHHSIKK